LAGFGAGLDVLGARPDAGSMWGTLRGSAKPVNAIVVKMACFAGELRHYLSKMCKKGTIRPS
jgi:hypothetical protein